jgi:hypothetical protein
MVVGVVAAGEMDVGVAMFSVGAVLIVFTDWFGTFGVGSCLSWLGGGGISAEHKLV